MNELIKRFNENQSGENLQDLSYAIALAVTSKIIMYSNNSYIRKMQQEIVVDIDNKKRQQFFNNSLNIDLMQEVSLKILEEVKAQREREKELPIDILRSYEKKELSKRIYIQKTDSLAYKIIETSPIIEVYRMGSRFIDNQRSPRSGNNGYSYISINEDHGEEQAYRRVKYSDLGSYYNDFNGKNISYYIDIDDINAVDKMIEKLKLTSTQLQVLKLRLQGYGYKAIATYRGVKPQSILSVVNAIQKKAIKEGFIHKKYSRGVKKN